MGQAKKRLMEYEEGISIIDGLISIYSNDIFENIESEQIIFGLRDLREKIYNLDNRSMEVIDLIAELTNNDLRYLYHRLSNILESIESGIEELPEVKNKITTLSNSLNLIIQRIRNQLNSYIHKSKNIYNSEKYYTEQILELENQKKELQKYLLDQKSIEGKSQEEIAENKKIIQEKEMSLLKAKEQIKLYQHELEEKKKSENAIIEWNSKIKSTFEELTICLSPIKNEHTRLNRMFWIYSSLITVIFIIIVSLEIYIFTKLHNSDVFPEWKNYIVALTPIPIFGGLLWGFIVQLNRTQRQLLILGKHIHEIKYIEGLLLSINSLSLNINDSTERVNNAINRLLENHLNRNLSSDVLTETNLIKEENKDSVPIDIVLKLLKETKGIISK
ncbi:hypothetical protein QK342_00215 [Myroides odoratimimus]|uniref:hypothetical protein n=1 Tax=Myroides odoratimimus TaxID=76832 RepID=UPI00103A11D9|nr:hypothetical protein [Myroides odoratimimus]QBK74897.1 hypothetical protein E0Z07_00215 [Myroides odoratimimus]WHT73574.1 hypothetical protein QK342_00215 [Myroides odoratimimus]WHU38156.1 hypothetical protein QNM93_00215 [Myroides odoratimimus]